MRRALAALLLIATLTGAAVAVGQVTIEGEVTQTFAPAGDGSSTQYELSDLDAADNFSIEATGVVSTDQTSDSSGSLSDGETLPLDVAGNLDATDAEVTFTGTGFERSDSAQQSDLSDGDSISLGVDGNLPATDAEVTLSGQESTTSKSPSWTSSSSSLTDTRSISVGGNIEPTDGSVSASTHKNTDRWYGADDGGSYDDNNGYLYAKSDQVSTDVEDIDVAGVEQIESITLYGDYGGSTDISVEGTHFGTVSGDSWEEVTLSEGSVSVPSDGVVTVEASTSGSIRVADVGAEEGYIDFESGAPSDVSVSTDTGDSASLGSGGSSSLDIGTSTSSLSVDGDGSSGGYVDWSASWTETTRSKNPSIDVDGDGNAEASYSGALAGGETSTTSISDLSPGSGPASISLASGTVDAEVSWTEREGSENPSIDVDGDGSSEASYSGALMDGETETTSVDDLSPGSGPASISLASGTVDATVEYTERTETPKFGVEVNGHWTNETLGLSDGETASLTTDTAWLQEDTNRVNVSIDDSGLSGDAPNPKVAIDYQHDAASSTSTEYSSEHWTERYNVSKTFSSDRDNATLTVPFNEKVYEVRDLQLRTNGGPWSDLQDYSIDDTTLTAQLGNIEAGDDVTIRTNGSRADVHNGSIEVLEPTMIGSELDSKIEIQDWSDSAYIGVPEVGDWDELHYTYNESWTDDSSTWQDADGEQRLRLPNADVGSTTRVSTIPLEANPTTGDVVLEVEEASATEPVVNVRPGDDPGDDVKFTHIDASDGTKYILWSYSKEIIRDQGTASSPLTLEDDDSEETLGFLIDSQNATSPPSDGDSGGVSLMGHEVREPRTPGETLLVAGLMLTVVIGAYLSTQRRDLPRKGIEAIPTRFLASRSVQIGLAVIAAVLAIRFNFIAVPAGMTAIVGIVGAVAGSYFMLRRFEMFSLPVFAAISTIAAVLGVELISPGTIGTLLGGEGVQRAIPFVLIAGVYLAYQGVQTWREGNTTEVVIGDDGSN